MRSGLKHLFYSRNTTQKPSTQSYDGSIKKNHQHSKVLLHWNNKLLPAEMWTSKKLPTQETHTVGMVGSGELEYGNP